jgi:aminoglycoside/choline kinase family phosphotransferase
MSLIDDVRIKTSLQLKKQIFQYYLTKTKISYAKEVSSFQKDFDILSIQRSLKIIGIFSRLCVRDKKKNYIKMLPYAWSLLHLRLKNPCFVELAKVIKKYFPKKLIQKIII